MGLFIRTQGTKKATGGISGESLAWNNYELRQIVIDDLYLDPLTKKPKNDEYFTKTQENINMAIQSGLSESRFVTIQKNISDLKRDRLRNTVDNNDYIKTSMDELEADIKDTWRQLWSGRETLSSGSFGVLAQAMEDYLVEQREQVIGFRDELSQVTNDPDRLEGLDKLIDKYEQEERFYRGAYSAPQRYRLDMATNEQGQVIDVQLKDVNSASNGFIDTKQTSSDGLKIYGRPNKAFTTDDGSQEFVIGGTKFSKLGEGFDVESDGEIDFSNLSLQDPTNSLPGDVLMSPNNVGYVKNQDGSYYKVRQSYAPEAGINMNRSYSISSDEADSIERSFQVVDFQAEIDQRNQANIQNRQELNGYMSIAPIQSEQNFTPDPSQQEKAKTTPRFVSTGAGKGNQAEGKQQEKSSFVKTVANIFSGTGKGIEETQRNMGLRE